MSSPHKWLVIFLLHEDFVLEENHEGEEGYICLNIQRKALFESIRNADFDERTKIIIIESQINRFHGDIRASSYFIERRQDGFHSYDLEGFTIQQEETLKKLLEQVIQKEKADRRMIVTWGHGSIFGVFYIQNLAQKLSSSTRKFMHSSANIKLNLDISPAFHTTINNFDIVTKPIPPFFDGNVDKVLEKFDLLTNRELARALEGSLPQGSKIDVLIMYNCLMQNVCTQYDLRNVVSYLVAPETGISHPGYNYTAILNYLKNDTADDINVAKVAIETIKENPLFNSENPELLAELEETWAIRAVNLSGIQDFADCFERVVAEMKKLSDFDDIIPLLKNAVRNSFDYAHVCLPNNRVVDLRVILFFFLKINTDLTAAKYKLLVATVNDCINSIKVDGTCMIGKKLFANGINDSIRPEQHSGFALLLPKNKSEIDDTRLAFLNREDLHPDLFKKTGYLALIQKLSKQGILG